MVSIEVIFLLPSAIPLGLLMEHSRF